MTSSIRTRTAPPPRQATDPTSSWHRVGGAVLAVGGFTLLTGLLVVPGPFVADVGASTWVPGHALNVAGYLLLVIGLPTVAGSLGPRLRWTGAVGYAALMTRFALSSGSHLYSMWLLPQLAPHRELHDDLTSAGPLASIYSGHGDLINLVLAIGLVGLAWTFWRCPRHLRMVAVLLLVTAVAQAASNPLALLGYAVLAIWLGLRLAVRGRVEAALVVRRS